MKYWFLPLDHVSAEGFIKENTQNMSKLLPAFRATGVRVWGMMLLFRGSHVLTFFRGCTWFRSVLLVVGAARPFTILCAVQITCLLYELC